MGRLIDAGVVESALIKWMYDRSDLRKFREVLDDVPTAGAEMITKYHQLERERDAAVADLNNNRKCAICKRFTTPIDKCPHYRECGIAYKYWEWRGVKEE